MFKIGDLALVVDGGQTVTIKGIPRRSNKSTKGIKSPIETTEGVFEESELRQAHPSVLANASGLLRRPERQEEVDQPKKDYTLREEVVECMKSAGLDNMEVDIRGHWKKGSDLYDITSFKNSIRDGFYPYGNSVSEDELRELRTALRAGGILDKWVSLGKTMVTSSGCSYCGDREHSLQTNGKSLRLSGDECPLPNGFAPNEWELNVPSGKIVVADDLRRWFPMSYGDNDLPRINSIAGQRMTSISYADSGMSHAFVGNTCPSVYSLGEGSFKISIEPPEDYWDAEIEEYVMHEPTIEVEGERVAGVTTDLWWYSICDLDEFERRVAVHGGSLDEAYGEVVDVTPGVYKFLHYDGVDRDRGNETVFSTFKWVRDADPLKDFLGSGEELDLNANAYVQAQVKNWPTLYGSEVDHDSETSLSWEDMSEEQRAFSWERVADHILMTIGSGTDWHPNGFPLGLVDPNVLDLDPPSFRKQCHWYPFSSPYGGIFRDEFTPSFAKLAFRVLESVISFGMDINAHEGKRYPEQTRNRMHAAVKRYRTLAKSYPDLADPDYVWWLSKRGRAKAWVENFDLGPDEEVLTDKHIESRALLAAAAKKLSLDIEADAARS